MKRIDSSKNGAALMLVFVASCLYSGAMPATTNVSQCATADGTSIYTDTSCRLIGARATPMPETLVKKLVRESTLSGTTTADSPTRQRPRTAGRSALHRVETDQCPKTPGQLAAALRTSLAGGDVNRLAAVYDWNGMTDKQARSVLQRLEKMSDRPLIDGRFFDARAGLAAWPGASQTDAGTAGDGIVQLVQGSGVAPTVAELAVTRRAGCLLLSFD
jgi:hypothetical protein